MDEAHHLNISRPQIISLFSLANTTNIDTRFRMRGQDKGGNLLVDTIDGAAALFVTEWLLPPAGGFRRLQPTPKPPAALEGGPSKGDSLEAGPPEGSELGGTRVLDTSRAET